MEKLKYDYGLISHRESRELKRDVNFVRKVFLEFIQIGREDFEIFISIVSYNICIRIHGVDPITWAIPRIPVLWREECIFSNTRAKERDESKILTHVTRRKKGDTGEKYFSDLFVPAS